MTIERKKFFLDTYNNTGLAGDYWNEIMVALPFEATPKKIANFLHTHPRRKYSERYLQDQYSNPVVTEQNRAAIQEMDALVDEMNHMTDPKTFDVARFIKIYNRIQTLIYGPGWERYHLTSKDIGSD